MKTRVIFLGPPGAGKGTYASRIMERLNIPQISTGDLLREAIRNRTEIGIKAEEYVSQGKLVPDDIVIEILKQRLAKDDCKNGFILDGFPRTIEQAKALDNITHIDLVINLVVPDEIIVKRLSSRIICKRCGAVYNLITLPPKKEGICDKCGGPLYQREDDKPEVIMQRLDVYKKQTAPLVEYYRNRGILVDIVCDKVDTPPEEVVDRIIKIMR
ncbi:MAG: adenylate kinase [Candidatus Diapherotrites archaeon]|nr:adenylate kinase [Candidatus Diapherotrites archaeon]